MKTKTKLVEAHIMSYVARECRKKKIKDFDLEKISEELANKIEDIYEDIPSNKD